MENAMNWEIYNVRLYFKAMKISLEEAGSCVICDIMFLKKNLRKSVGTNHP